jgi:outer membrane protein assembly factor BamB
MRIFVSLCCMTVLAGCGRESAGRRALEALSPGVSSREEAIPQLPEGAFAHLGTRKQGCDWPAFLGPLGTGVSPEKGIITPWPRKGLRIIWQKEIGAGYGMPVISRGRLFHFDRFRDQALLTCLKSETGEVLWRFGYRTHYEDYYGYNNGPRCCPVVDDDRVYIHGAEGMLHCVRAADGRLLWKVDTKAEFGVVQNHFGVASAPVVEGDLLIVQVGGSPPGEGQELSLSMKGNGTGVVAFDKRTGRVRYRVSDELASYASPVLATINDRRWCFVFARGGLIGLEPARSIFIFHGERGRSRASTPLTRSWSAIRYSSRKRTVPAARF